MFFIYRVHFVNKSDLFYFSKWQVSFMSACFDGMSAVEYR